MSATIFDSVAVRKPTKNRFSLSYEKKMSYKMGQLVPGMVIECIPGDRFKLGAQLMHRFAPLISPVMHRVHVKREYFFVPNRLLWSEFENFITGVPETGEHPYIQVSSVLNSSLADHMGIPVGTYNTGKVNALPYAAYALIFDEWYRHQDLQDKRFTPLVSGNNTTNYGAMFNGAPFKRNWMRDSLTSALPFAQRGQPVQLPLTSTATVPVEVIDNVNPGIIKAAGSNSPSAPEAGENLTVATGPSPFFSSMHYNGDPSYYDPNGSLGVDINAESVTIATLRWAVRLQEFFELAARAGNRYTEMMRAMFGQKSSDARLRRPEYIGGTTGKMVISEVLATAQNTEADIPVGNMSGHGISFNGGQEFYYNVEEHGFLIAIDSVIPVTAYQQGIHRMWRKDDRFDYAFPTFAQLGEQAIRQDEVYAESSTPDAEFGYNVRYYEYKHRNSEVSGEFRDTLSFWHLGRIFESEPTLSEEFIQCDVDAENLTRIFAVQDNVDHLYVQLVNDVQVLRALPRVNIPTL